MTVKIFDNTTITSGYVLTGIKSTTTVITLTATAEIDGMYGSAGVGAPGNGGAGGVGLTVEKLAPTYNWGVLNGGAGGAGAEVTNYLASGTLMGGAGGAGGAGVYFSSSAVLRNSNEVAGGAGGGGAVAVNSGVAFAVAGSGGAGGVGVGLSAATLVNTGAVAGGAGGAGGLLSIFIGGPTDGYGGAGGAGGAGVTLRGAGVIDNYGTIMGGAGGAGGEYNGVNTPGANGVGGDGMDLYPTTGATVVNGSSTNQTALIEGAIGIYVAGSVGKGAGVTTVTNFGTVQGTSGLAVQFTRGNTILVWEAGSTFIGSIIGGGGALEVASGGIVTLANLGGYATLASTTNFRDFGTYIVDARDEIVLTGDSQLASGRRFTVLGTLSLAAGQTFVNDGQITATSTLAGASQTGLYASYATFTNGATGGIAAANGVDATQATVINLGVIYGSDIGIDSRKGPSVIINGSTGDVTANIDGYNGGVQGAHGTVTLTNYGLISQVTNAGGVVAGVDLYGGGTILNAASGQISGYQGVYLDLTSSVRNLGTIMGQGARGSGVSLQAGGAVTNGSTATHTSLIEGYFGVYASAGATVTVTNGGTIAGTGGASVVFNAASDRLIVEAGSSLIGVATGGGGTLEVAGGSGTVASLGVLGAFSGAAALTAIDFAAYQIDAGTWQLAGLALGASQKLDIENGAVAQLVGVSSNAGTIALLGGTANTDLRVLALGATLSGGGTVKMSGTKARVLGVIAASALTNVDNTITGTGLLGANSLTLINQAKGVIDAVGAAGLTVGTKGETLTNQGLMEATGGGTLVLASDTVANTGGTILANSGAPVKLQDDDIRGGGITAAGTGVVKINVAGGELDGTTSAVSLSGFIHVVSTANEILEGSIANAGKLNLTAGTKTCDLIIGAAGATLSGGGQVNLSNSLGNRIYGQASGDTLTNVDNRIDGAGLIGNGTMTLINQAGGQILGNQNLSLTIDTGTNTIVNAGLIENGGKGGTLVKSAVNNTGTLKAVTAGTFTLAGTVTGAGVGQINGGTLNVEQAFAEIVTFTGSTGVLELGDSQAFTGKVAGLSGGGTNFLDLGDIGFFASKTKATYSGTSASGTLTVTDGTHTASISLIGDYIGATWTLTGDGNGGTKVSDPSGGGASSASSPAPFSQAISSFHPRTTPGLAAWTARPSQASPIALARP